MQICLCLLVSHDDGVVILDGNRLHRHDVIAERFLKLRGHEVVPRARFGQDGKVHLEPEEVEQEWHDDQP